MITFDRLRPFLHLVGVETDTAIAQQSRVVRPLITWLRGVLRIPAAPWRAVAPDRRADCLRRVRARETLVAVSKATGLAITAVRKLAATIGWDRSWTRHHKQPKAAQIGRLSRARIEAELRKGTNRSKLARLAGVSHQRIGQIANAAGIPGRRTILRPVIAAKRAAKARATAKARRRRERERKARAARNRTKLRHFLMRARRLHARGFAISAIAKTYGLSANSMSWWLFKGRRELGWFPKR